MRTAKFHTIKYGEPIPEVGSLFDKEDCLIIVQKAQGSNDVKLLYADGGRKVTEVKPYEFEEFLTKNTENINKKLDKTTFEEFKSDNSDELGTKANKNASNLDETSIKSWKTTLEILNSLQHIDQNIPENTNRIINVPETSNLKIQGLKELENSTKDSFKAMISNNNKEIKEIDVTNWQRYSLVQEDGSFKSFGRASKNVDELLETGFYYLYNPLGDIPITDKNRWFGLLVFPFTGNLSSNNVGTLQIIYSLQQNGDLFYRLQNKFEGKNFTTWRKFLTFEDIEVLTSNNSEITFDRARDYGSSRNPLSDFTVSNENAKRGVTNIIWFNGASLPNIRRIDWSHTDDFFIPNTTHKIVLCYVDNNTILGNLL